MKNRISVAIIGAGPTGLTAALCLSRLGIDCFVLDKGDGPVNTSNALGVQARTLEVWNSLGIIEDALEKGVPIRALNIYDDKEKIAHITLDHLKTSYPYILGLPQAETERILLKKLSSLGTVVHHRCELKEITQHPHNIEIIYRDENGLDQYLTAHWLLGCDGSHSHIRELLDIPFSGNNLPQHFIMADLPLISSFRDDEVHSFLSLQGTMVIIPLQSFCRLIIDVTNEPDLAKAKAPNLETFKKLSKERSFIPFELENPLWTSSFGVHEHVAKAYQHDRVFLLGDAAHEHSPVGAQGMNTGIQDAFNLCWKIAMVEGKRAHPSFLRSYEKERLPIAKTVVESTTVVTKLLTSRLSWVRKAFKEALSILHRIPIFEKNAAKIVSHLNVNYANQGFCTQNGFWLNGVKPGYRAPLELILLQPILSYEKFHILIFTGKNSFHGDFLRSFIENINRQFPFVFDFIIVQNKEMLSPPVATLDDFNNEIHKRFGVTNPAYYVIRPDQYIAYRSQQFNIETFSRFFKKMGFSATQ